MSYGRVVLSAILALFLGLFVAADLVLFGVVPLNSIVVTIVPLAALVLGAVLGIAAHKRHSGEAGDSVAGQPLPPPQPAV